MLIHRFIKQRYFNCKIMFELDKVKKGFPVKVKLVMLRPLCYFVAESLALRAHRSLAASNKSTLYDLSV